MISPPLIAVTLTAALLSSLVHAELPYDPALVGTWSSKSKTVLTGPDFYDPVAERLKEPRLPGISFSFSADGFFEEAQYVVISNPTTPECPQGMMQFQHGSYKLYENGSLILDPIKVDGRQLLSNPCKHSKSIYTRYNQSSIYKGYEVLTDTYRGMKRLNLYKFDGTPMNPMYIAFSPPQMLPTVTLNPLPTGTGAAKKKDSARKERVKRSFPEGMRTSGGLDADRWWWVGVGMIGAGLVGWFCV